MSLGQIVLPEVGVALLNGSQTPIEFRQMGIALKLRQTAVQIHAFLLRKIVGAVALDIVGSRPVRLPACDILNGHIYLQCYKERTFSVYHTA